MSTEERIWYTLKYGVPTLRIVRRARDDGPLGATRYIEYIVTDKPLNQINRENTDETSIRKSRSQRRYRVLHWVRS